MLFLLVFRSSFEIKYYLLLQNNVSTNIWFGLHNSTGLLFYYTHNSIYDRIIVVHLFFFFSLRTRFFCYFLILFQNSLNTSVKIFFCLYLSSRHPIKKSIYAERRTEIIPRLIRWFRKGWESITVVSVNTRNK